jgi:histidine triad (HIT) family protein
MGSCVFCSIVKGSIPAEIVFENSHCIAFRDLKPQAPHHYLIIPREHLTDLNGITPKTSAGVAQLLEVAAQLAKQQGISQSGYRCVINNGADAGQEVPHLHLHLLAGRRLSWPPG